MISLNDVGSIKLIRNINSLDDKLSKVLIGVSLRKDFKLATFVNEDNLDEICKEEPFKPKGSEIYVRFGAPLSSPWDRFVDAVSRAVAESVHESAQKMRSDWVNEMRADPGRRVFDGRERLQGTKSLSAPKLEVESAIAKADAYIEKSSEMVLVVALFQDGTVGRGLRKNEVRSMLEDKLFSRASLGGCCCEPQGVCCTCDMCVLTESFSKLVAWLLSEYLQPRWCCS
jgi:hypothetical protein